MNLENQNKETEKKSGKKKRNFLYFFMYFFSGKLLTEDFFIKQSKLFLMIFVLILIFISNRYNCSKQLSEMDRLKQELIRLENEKINLNSRLTRISRQIQIEELLQKQGVELTSANPNVYKISR